MSGAEDSKLFLIRCHLSCIIPIIIADLLHDGGPTEEQFEAARVFSTTLGANGDAILYRIKGKTAEMMDRLSEAIAILAFCPGGITTFGLHFEAHAKENYEMLCDRSYAGGEVREAFHNLATATSATTTGGQPATRSFFVGGDGQQ